ncbi:flagellar biosynthesis sigma factor [Burkholderia diffusa]|uniref:Flagellar biosynthesis sigma factor n=2 Tax=Burkholderia diffusa TaxID=488732 RepID=A0AAW3P8I3_9BURK|nr:flagellar biosynthesis sigma factor [Burkholderia diffusa]KVN03058.1 flagellar biosynthesis sigma factor [Burkholderia diffusa]KWF41462.1 flagellar biosynthesis sigma factor [Burkholderia diffusa]KWF44285.1 flagellar biosynthesis sigma factor [Burkholderia diffusa]KWF45195.1 flagellar biosynthesis sigma factor [Burkholderia diffusa]
MKYAPIVKRAARQLSSQSNGSMALEDIEQIGLMGLLEALRRYGAPDDAFPGYAATRVRGAILDELRRHDWRPRAVRQDAHRTRDCERALCRTLGREPTEAEVSDALGISVDEYRKRVMANNAEAMMSFDMLLDGDMLTHEESPEREVVRRRCLEQALTRLNERERHVIQLYYEFDLSLREIAAVLGLTEARVCQINKASLKKMREALSDA